MALSSVLLASKASTFPRELEVVVDSLAQANNRESHALLPLRPWKSLTQVLVCPKICQASIS